MVGIVVVVVLLLMLFTVFVGYTDISSCNFDREGCVWSLGEGVVTRADAATPPLPVTDANNNARGKSQIVQTSGQHVWSGPSLSS